MRLQSALLGKLHKLKAQDRAWLVGQLSEQEKAQLLARVAAPDAVAEIDRLDSAAADGHPPQAEPKFADVVRSLSRVEPRRIAAVVKGEPAWLVVVICSAQQDAWGKTLLDALPAAQRADVQRIQLRQAHFGAALTQSATRLVLTRCHAGNVPAESAFDRLVERLGTSRAKKRLSLHL